jgi:hypothetical protein
LDEGVRIIWSGEKKFFIFIIHFYIFILIRFLSVIITFYHVLEVYWLNVTVLQDALFVRKIHITLNT